ncbi:MAG: hypothetical protein QN213_09210 [Armatimonadota bacterium]|nr:hypothetical protein [Armatimonadota bacterium]MDR7530932.1 hypothetical protein [Armatimonadota bacterium]
MRNFWALLAALPLSLAALPGSRGAAEAVFRKAAELREPSAQVRKAALFPDGRVAYYWERTRPPTDQEKDRRAAWFDAEWERFRRQAEQDGIPQIERSSEHMARKLEEEAAKQPVVVRPLFAFLSAAFRGLPAWLRWVIDLTLPVARRHFINQPVVVEAGLRMWDPSGKTAGLLPVDVPGLYGEESWARFPADELHLRASPDGKYVALETAEEAFVLFELARSALSPRARVRGGSPLGWSPDGRLLFVTRSVDGREFIAVHAADDLRELARCPADFDRRLMGTASSSAIIQDVAIAEDRLAVALFTDLGVCRLPAGSLALPDPATLRRIGPPRGLVFAQNRPTLYVASLRGLAVIDPDTFAILDQYLLPPASDFDFQRLAGVSPDGRYVAALHGRERLGGWATLFVWDVAQRRIVQRIGTQPGRMLDTISSGFRFIYPPAQLTRDWRYLLVVRQDGVLELYHRTP